ncbi:MAG: ribokinase [Verrucomicrobiales bacterium]
MSNQPSKRGILVVGSINSDWVIPLTRMPLGGETLEASPIQYYAGGKGANQAVAAARMGACVRLMGRVGDDRHGQQQLEALKQEGILTSLVGVDDKCSTGTAIILVEPQGQNRILLIPGANHALQPAWLASHDDVFQNAELMLVQLELPNEVVEQALHLAKEHGAQVLLDPAPVRPLPETWKGMVTYLTPNLIELAGLTQEPLDAKSPTGQIHQAALKLCRQGFAKTVITKMGERGALMTTLKDSYHCAAPRVQAVDSTAAGDCFNGVFAAMLLEGCSDREAMKWAVHAASLSVTIQGAQPSMPHKGMLKVSGAGSV